MSRRKQAEKRSILPDPKFGSEKLAKFVNMVMQSGKKAVAERIVYGALDQIGSKRGGDPMEILTRALDNVRPMVEVKSRRVGGATYQVPVEVRPTRQQALAMRWIIESARARTESPCPCGWPTNCWKLLKPTATQSRSAKTCTAWPRLTRLSPTTAGKHSFQAFEISRILSWPVLLPLSVIATSASWLTSMPARPPRPSAFFSIPAYPIRSARCTMAPPSWTGWSRSRSAASPLPPRLPPASGKAWISPFPNTASISSIRPARGLHHRSGAFAAGAGRCLCGVLCRGRRRTAVRNRMAPGHQVRCAAAGIRQQDGQGRRQLLPGLQADPGTPGCNPGTHRNPHRRRGKFQGRGGPGEDESHLLGRFHPGHALRGAGDSRRTHRPGQGMARQDGGSRGRRHGRTHA